MNYEGIEKKTAVSARKAKRRLETPLTEAAKSEKVVAEVERQRKIHRTTVQKNEKSRVKAERRSTARVGGLAAEATRNSSRRKCHPLTNEQNYEKARR